MPQTMSWISVTSLLKSKFTEMYIYLQTSNVHATFVIIIDAVHRSDNLHATYISHRINELNFHDNFARLPATCKSVVFLNHKFRPS